MRHKILLALIVSLISACSSNDIEVDVSGLGNRRGLNKKIENILRQDWTGLDSAIESKIANNHSTIEFKNQRERFQAMLGEFE